MHNFLLLLFTILLLSCNRGEVSTYTKYLNLNDTVRYVGQEQCRACHSDIYESYMKTGMGRSLNYAVKGHSALTGTEMFIIYDTIKNFFYEPFFKNDSLYIKEFRLKEKDTTHLLIRKVDYKIGSGHHTNSHLFEINGFLHQIPYTYYTQDKVADFPPGFEGGQNSRFSREIGLECMSCHNAYPNHDSGSHNMYSSIPQGIDCERCHGPGEVHVKQKLSGIIVDTSKYIDYSIVNPAKLPIDLQLEICQRCHLQGTTVLAEGKSYTDFKPGMYLNDVMDTYLPKYKNDNTFIMASHVDRLKQSACFKNADLTCTSCHNPHKSVKDLSSNYFDNKCMQCHNVCNDNQIENCISCHMPSSSSSDIMHVTITDHKIGFHHDIKSEKGAFRGLVAINNNNPTNISKAKAYLKHFESFENNPIYLDSALYYLQNTTNNFPYFIQYYYLINDRNSLINFVISSSLDTSIYSNSLLAMSFSRIGEFMSLEGMNNSAQIYFKKSLDLMPQVIDYKIKYAIFLIQNSQYKKAKAILNHALHLNPTVKEIHLNLGYLAILNQEYQIAENFLNQAIALDPDYILAFENFVLLGHMQKKDTIIQYYSNKILEIAPSHNLSQFLNGNKIEK